MIASQSHQTTHRGDVYPPKLYSLDPNETVTAIKVHGKISSAEYQQVAGAIKKTATRDLNDLKKKGVVEQRGNRGPGVHYILAKKGT